MKQIVMKGAQSAQIINIIYLRRNNLQPSQLSIRRCSKRDHYERIGKVGREYFLEQTDDFRVDCISWPKVACIRALRLIHPSRLSSLHLRWNPPTLNKRIWLNIKKNYIR